MVAAERRGIKKKKIASEENLTPYPSAHLRGARGVAGEDKTLSGRSG